ncbi:hypothetical protein K450DRAFT_233380 [Umbelopsis ramanniana AG]|uniref:ABC1 atypical kinase-like domain-containing protein n=1 Tax=Umbelopsis ramanniana AG TaxID=1314678 RepID=A0AAD5HE90_UMBRA|nr:uncharacterized protein K450DRAFT_233380 [Umbelopsis ramanniana AG]KAI8581160.1 hypothetical protein K450DRAFT_233380 [Umbelopsis ramanniana AG]
MTFPPSQKRPLARRLLKPLSITASTALIGTVLYYNHEPSRHFMCAIERCGRAGLVGVRVAINYKLMLSKTYKDSEEEARAKSNCHTTSANLVLKALQKSGGIYIKLGQHVSAMVYILPPEWTSTMAVLQDKCPPTPYQEIEELFQNDMGTSLDDLFSEFDPVPIGVASLAQVHRARLRSTGEEVAVKMQHPFLDEFCKIDMDTVSFILSTIKRVFPEFGFEWLSEEMNESLPQELNFVFEASNANKVRENFKELIETKKTALIIPKIVWAHRRILCMEFIRGQRIDNLAYMEEHSIDSNRVSIELTRIFSEMIYNHGFVHCDPHPGNVLIRPAKKSRFGTGLNFEIVLLDHGLYRTLDDQLRTDYAHLWTSLIRGNEEDIKKYSLRVGGTSAHKLFASVMTGRSWDTVNTQDLSTERSQTELEKMTEGAFELLIDIAGLLANMPRIVLLLLKTNDLLRSVDEVLRTDQDYSMTYVVMGRYCAKAVWDDIRSTLLDKIRHYGLSIKLAKELISAWYEFESLEIMLWLYQTKSLWMDRIKHFKSPTILPSDQTYQQHL